MHPFGSRAPWLYHQDRGLYHDLYLLSFCTEHIRSWDEQIYGFIYEPLTYYCLDVLDSLAWEYEYRRPPHLPLR